MNRRRLIDLVIVLAALEPVVRDGFGGVATALVFLPLLARERFPFAAPTVIWAYAAALSFADGRLVPDALDATLAGMAAAFLLGQRAGPGLAIVVAGATVVEFNYPEHTTSDLIFTPLLFVIAWVAGYVLRERTEQAELKATLAAAEERARIARELHDIVAHSMSVMVLQVGAVRHRLPAGDDRAALIDVEQTGRTALTEMRLLLGALRREDPELAPQPGLDRLPALIKGVDRAGLPVTLTIEGPPRALPAALDLSAYRIVQEGLTNTLKHAKASHVEVHVAYEPDVLRLEVRDDGQAASQGDGYGLAGVKERVKIYGGEMTAGRTPDGFVLSTTLPLP